MNSEVVLSYDRFPIVVQAESIKKLIKDEIKRLSEKTKLPGDKLPIKFVNDPKVGYIGCYSFSYSGQKVISESFTFNFYHFKGFSARQIIDVTRHEFSHYARRCRYGIHTGEAHDTKFRDVCRELDCNGNAYHSQHTTQIFKHNTVKHTVTF